MKFLPIFLLVISFLWAGELIVLHDKSEMDFWLLAGVVAVVVVAGLTYKYRRLDELVRQRTDELEKFNQRLKDEIDKAVEKNRTQEKILMQQAKMAEIGSMVESIAHQWRQPLNILGLSMTRLNINLTLGNREDVSKIIDVVEQQIAYMSQT
ncbi:MAG TPA: hypothetical protein VFX57_04495, partial [Sulfuricurvum sp.]|nr:hypothetical protein [Sulfuricurvum sp.]